MSTNSTFLLYHNTIFGGQLYCFRHFICCLYEFKLHWTIFLNQAYFLSCLRIIKWWEWRWWSMSSFGSAAWRWASSSEICTTRLRWSTSASGSFTSHCTWCSEDGGKWALRIKVIWTIISNIYKLMFLYGGWVYFFIVKFKISVCFILS